MDPAALAEDEAAHLGVPAARLVAEMHSGLQQLLDSYLSHLGTPLIRVVSMPAGPDADPARRPGRATPHHDGVVCVSGKDTGGRSP